MRSEDKLIFVYNANSGFLNSLKDLMHKNIRPATYPCRLCAITYDNTGMISTWSRFIDSLDLKVEFLHKDEFKELFSDADHDLPAAFLITKEGIRPFISAVEMNRLSGLDDLIELVRSRSST